MVVDITLCIYIVFLKKTKKTGGVIDHLKIMCHIWSAYKTTSLYFFYSNIIVLALIQL
jgi:hypothetical protein